MNRTRRTFPAVRGMVVAALTVFGARAAAPVAESFIQSSVLAPFPDGVNLAVPEELRDNAFARLGFVDVTAPPFGADPSGARDCTTALQRAIEFARDRQMVCFFPPGTYTVSDTLRCTELLYRRTNGALVGSRFFACVLVGSRAGAERPRLVLAPRSPGFGDSATPKFVVHFWARDPDAPEEDKPGVNMNQMLVGLDIVIGAGNAGAIGVRHRGAQGSGVQDCTIDATQGLAGVQGSCASGGHHAGVTVIGGRIGLDFRNDDRPGPLISGVTLTGQTESAIVFSGRQTLTAVGLKITVPGRGPAMVGEVRGGVQGGQINLVDSEIVFTEPAETNTAISSSASLVLQNTYVRGAGAVAHFTDGTELKGAVSGWLRVREFAHGLPFKIKGVSCPMPIYVDGLKSGDVSEVEPSDSGPPADLQGRHLWPADFPHWQMPSVADVTTAPYNAKGDGVTDDTAALQRAIDRSEFVFLPKGYYRINRTLRLRSNTKMFGIARHLATIVATERAGDFADPLQPAPLVLGADDALAATVLATLAIFAPRELGDTAYTLDWRCGGNSLVRDVNFLQGSRYGFSRPPPNVPAGLYTVPHVRISGGGGGRWFNFFQEAGYSQAPDFRHLLIDGTRGPLAIYMCNPEHAISDVNMEIRDSRYVTVYGLKSETTETKQPPLWIRDSDHVRLFGIGGIAMPAAGRALVTVSNTPNFLFAGATGQLTLFTDGTSPPAEWTDPHLWNMIAETLAGQTLHVPPMERPVWFKRGRPLDRAFDAGSGGFVNLSARSLAGTGSNTLIVGFAVSGPGPKSLLIRGIGPALAAFGVAGALGDPVLQFFSGSGTANAQNDNWGDSPATAVSIAATAQSAGAFALAPGSKDAVLLTAPTAGSYTAQLSGVDGTSGVALVEIYDAAKTASAKLTNVSARSVAGNGASVLIVGFAISGDLPKAILVRGAGPALTAFGVTGALADPQLQLFSSNSTLLAQNDNWGDSPAAAEIATLAQKVGAFALPANSKDAALLVTLPPGTYTAQVSGVDNTTGIALVELYEAP
jgi:hypothetical protein